MDVKQQEVYDRIIDNIKRYRKREQLSQKSSQNAHKSVKDI